MHIGKSWRSRVHRQEGLQGRSHPVCSTRDAFPLIFRLTCSALCKLWGRCRYHLCVSAAGWRRTEATLVRRWRRNLEYMHPHGGRDERCEHGRGWRSFVGGSVFQLHRLQYPYELQLFCVANSSSRSQTCATIQICAGGGSNIFHNTKRAYALHRR